LNDNSHDRDPDSRNTNIRVSNNGVEEFTAIRAPGDISSSPPSSSVVSSLTSEAVVSSPLLGAAPLITMDIRHDVIKNTEKITTEPIGVSLITTGTELVAHSNEAEVNSVAALDVFDRDEELILLKRRERYLKVAALFTYIVTLNKSIIYSLI
jgi:hypothetical protein